MVAGRAAAVEVDRIQRSIHYSVGAWEPPWLFVVVFANVHFTAFTL